MGNNYRCSHCHCLTPVPVTSRPYWSSNVLSPLSGNSLYTLVQSNLFILFLNYFVPLRLMCLFLLLFLECYIIFGAVGSVLEHFPVGCTFSFINSLIVLPWFAFYHYLHFVLYTVLPICYLIVPSRPLPHDCFLLFTHLLRPKCKKIYSFQDDTAY